MALDNGSPKRLPRETIPLWTKLVWRLKKSSGVCAVTPGSPPLANSTPTFSSGKLRLRRRRLEHRTDDGGFRCWHFTSFRGIAEIRSLSE